MKYAIDLYFRCANIRVVRDSSQRRLSRQKKSSAEVEAERKTQYSNAFARSNILDPHWRSGLFNQLRYADLRLILVWKARQAEYNQEQEKY